MRGYIGNYIRILRKFALKEIAIWPQIKKWVRGEIGKELTKKSGGRQSKSEICFNNYNNLKNQKNINKYVISGEN